MRCESRQEAGTIMMVPVISASQTTWLKVKLKLVNYHFIPELMDVFLMAGVHQQPEQSNYLAEGQTLTCKRVLTQTQPGSCRMGTPGPWQGSQVLRGVLGLQEEGYY